MIEALLVLVMLLALPLAAMLIALGYMAAFNTIQGALLSLGAYRARRLILKRGGVHNLTDHELYLAERRISARMALRPYYRKPAWLHWGYQLKEELALHRLSREAWALARS